MVHNHLKYPIKTSHRRRKMPVEQKAAQEQKVVVTGDLFIRPHIRKFSPYKPVLPANLISSKLGRDSHGLIKLDANENPYGPPPQVAEALGDMEALHRYPDPSCSRLRAAISESTGLRPDCLIIGCGADELIGLIIRCVIDPGEKILDCPPTFLRYESDAGLNGARVIKVMRKQDFSLNIPAIVEAVHKEHPKCIFLSSPNNPDGSVISDKDLVEILKLPILVVLDEAYVEFSGMESRAKWVQSRENLIVLRTFSKITGLAGLRVGYGAFPLSMVQYMSAAKLPYGVSAAAEVAACTALLHPNHTQRVRDMLVRERERMYSLLKGVPYLKPFPSHANFVICEVVGEDGSATAGKLQEELAKMGVIVRHYDTPELNRYVRISAGKPEDTEVLMSCLKSPHMLTKFST